MTSEGLTLFQMLLLAAIVFEMVASFQTARTVPGTRQRYVWASYRRGASWLVNAGFLIQGFVFMVSGSPFVGGFSAVIGIISVFMELRRGNDDDWWSDSWKKLKRGFRARQHAMNAA